MLLSDPFPVKFFGEQATLVVIRNDGYCWGRLCCPDGDMDVSIDDDLYDEPDVVVAEVLIGAITSGTATVEPSLFGKFVSDRGEGRA